MVRYTIAICNLNMVKTVERSLESILEQVEGDDAFEVLVVDGGSTDGSRDVLRRLESEYDRLRTVFVDPEPGEVRHLGADRNRSFEEARGEYVVHHFDTDDVFVGSIHDLLTVYHQLEATREEPFALNVGGVNIAPRDLLMEYPYNNLTGSEDMDFWRRLLVDDALLWVEARDQTESIGYDRDWRGTLHRWWEAQVANLQTGISFWSYLVFLVRVTLPDNPYTYRYSWKRTVVDAVRLPFAYVEARYRRERYDSAPPGWRRMGSVPAWVERNRVPLDELADRIGADIDRSELETDAFDVESA